MTFQAAALAAYAAADGAALAGGSIQILDSGSVVLTTHPLNTPASTSAGPVSTFAGFPKSAAALASGNAASARLRTSGGADYKTGLSVGIAGSGAQVIIDNGAGTLAITAGASVQIAAGPTLTHA